MTVTVVVDRQAEPGVGLQEIFTVMPVGASQQRARLEGLVAPLEGEDHSAAISHSPVSG